MTATRATIALLVALSCAAALSVAGCGGSSGVQGAANPGGGPSPLPGALVYLTEVSGNNEAQSTNVLGVRVSDVLGQTHNGPPELIQTPVVDEARSLALDASYNMYVADQVNQEIFEFSAGSTGPQVYPNRTISSTGVIVEPRGIAVSAAGNVYVSDDLAGPFRNGAIEEFGATQFGNVQPIRLITGQGTNLNLPVGIAVDARGNVYVANVGSASIEEFSPSSGTPIRTIAGQATGLDQPVAIALDPAGDIYVANQGSNSVAVYAASAQGNAAPTRTIAGSATTISFPEGLALDAAGNVWVTNLHGGEPGAVTVFAQGAAGNVPPMATYTANNSTYAFNPSGIAILPP